MSSTSKESELPPERLTNDCDVETLHFLQLYLLQPCTQVIFGLHNLHFILTKPCVQTIFLLHSLQKRFILECTQILDPPHSLQFLRSRSCEHMIFGLHFGQLDFLLIPCSHPFFIDVFFICCESRILLHI